MVAFNHQIRGQLVRLTPRPGDLLVLRLSDAQQSYASLRELTQALVEEFEVPVVVLLPGQSLSVLSGEDLRQLGWTRDQE